MLSEREQQHVKRIAKKHRSRPKIVNADSIPNKGDDDAYGNPFTGLGRQKIADNAIGTDEADNQFLDVKHSPIIDGVRRHPPGVKQALSDVIGSLDVNDLGGGGAGHTIAPNLMPGLGNIAGTLDVANLGGGGAGHTIASNLLPNIAGLDGDLPLSRTTGDLGPGRVPGLAKLKGKVKAHSQIDWGNGPSIPPSAVRDGYDYRRLDHKPSLKKFLTRADFRADGTLKR